MTNLFYLIFYVPANNIVFYYLISIPVLISLIIFNKVKISNHLLRLLLFITSFFLFCVLLRFILYDAESILDILEYSRILFVFLLIALIKDFNSSDIIKYLTFYLLTDFTISIFQFFSINNHYLAMLNAVYNFPSNSILLERDSVRALGISPGIAEHGAIYSMYCIFWLIQFYKGYNKFLSLSFLAISFSGLLIIQSKTAIIASSIAFLITSAIYMFKNNSNFRPHFVVVLMTTIFISLTPLLLNNLHQIEKIYLIISSGDSSSSFDARFDIWMTFLNFLFDDVLLFIFGAGRYLVSDLGSTFDSDYVFILTSYGSIFFIFIYLYILFLPKFVKIDYKVYYCFVLNLMILSLATSPLTSPVCLLVFICIIKVLKDDRHHS